MPSKARNRDIHECPHIRRQKPRVRVDNLDGHWKRLELPENPRDFAFLRERLNLVAKKLPATEAAVKASTLATAAVPPNDRANRPKQRAKPACEGPSSARG